MSWAWKRAGRARWVERGRAGGNEVVVAEPVSLCNGSKVASEHGIDVVDNELARRRGRTGAQPHQDPSNRGEPASPQDFAPEAGSRVVHLARDRKAPEIGVGVVRRPVAVAVSSHS